MKVSKNDLKALITELTRNLVYGVMDQDMDTVIIDSRNVVEAGELVELEERQIDRPPAHREPLH